MKNETLEAVRPLTPLAGYVGGKRILAKTLVPMIEATPHAIYAEPFLGMGGVFFRRASRPKVEAVNDRSRDVATFFRILQRHHRPFIEMLRWPIASRAEFERLLKVAPETLTDLERAARFLYLQKLAFSGKVDGRSFGVSFDRPARLDVARLTPLLEAAHERLAGVYVECLRWQDFLTRYDRPGALFFLDPPYWGVEDTYGAGMFERAEFDEMAARLAAIKGRFILTVNDRAELRRLFAFASIEGVRLEYRVSGRPTEAREIIVTGGAS